MRKVSAKEVAAALVGAKEYDGYYMARCPAHDDKTPSLKISPKSDGTFKVKCMAGCNQDVVFKMVLGKLGIPGSKNQHKRIWKEAVSLGDSENPAKEYLASRGLKDFDNFKNIRFHPQGLYLDGEGKASKHPILVGAVRDENNLLTAITRIYLTPEGNKAPVENPKKALGAFNGGSVRFGKAKGVLNVCEGLETGLGVFQGTGTAVWAALTAANLTNLIIPDHVKAVHIWADHDPNATGLKGAEMLATRLRKEGKKVLIHLPVIPEGYLKKRDWLDVLNSDGAKTITKAFRKVPSRDDGKAPVTVIQTEWPKPNDFCKQVLPQLPLESFPKVFRNFIKGVSDSVDVCPSLAAMHLLGVLSLGSAKAFRIRTKPDHEEPANLYIAAPMRSGERKSPVLEALFAPVYGWEKKKSDEMKNEIETATSKNANQKSLIESLRKKLGRAKDKDELRSQIEEEEKKQIDIPSVPILTATDVTPEMTAETLRQQFGRLGFVDAEGTIFENITGRYSNKPNYEIFLKGYTGEQAKVMRKGSGEKVIFVEKPAITFCLSPQPSVVRDLAKAHGVSDRGFLPRFLYCYPKESVDGHKYETPAVDQTVRRKYERRVRSLLNFSYDLLKEGSDPILLIFDTDASNQYRKFYEKLQRDLTLGGKLFPIYEWASKFHGQTARLILLLHVAEFFKGGTIATRKVNVETVNKAVAISNVLAEHALYAYEDMRVGEQIKNALTLVDWIKHKKLKTVTRRDCQSRFRGRFMKAEDLTPILNELCERHILRLLEHDTSKSGRPSEIYAVNPRIINSG